jgi:signal transduction histidine kinase
MCLAKCQISDYKRLGLLNRAAQPILDLKAVPCLLFDVLSISDSGSDRSFKIGVPAASEEGGILEDISGNAKQGSDLWPYGSAVLFVCTAIVITSLLQRVFAVPFWFSFLGAVMASAWFGGKGPGWLAVVLSAIAVDRLFLPATIGGAVTREGIPFLFAFIVCALFANWFSSWRTRIEHSLRDARDQLDARVMQRTLELRSANDALLVEIQERKRAQEAVAVAQADLAHVNRVLTIGELTASLAHEVSQPLLAVLTSAGACERWLANDPPDIERARNAVARITKAGSRASEIVSGARALFKKGKPEHRSIQMNEIIQETVSLLHDEATRRGIRIYTELDPALPQGMGDVTHLQQVIMNLMMNAMDATDGIQNRSPDVHILTRRSGPNEVLVTVQDSGIGLDPENMEMVFQPYFTTKDRGLGMGLSISRTIVESHGGRLWATPGSNFGAIFQFNLPTNLESITEQDAVIESAHG